MAMKGKRKRHLTFSFALWVFLRSLPFSFGFGVCCECGCPVHSLVGLWGCRRCFLPLGWQCRLCGDFLWCFIVCLCFLRLVSCSWVCWCGLARVVLFFVESSIHVHRIQLRPEVCGCHVIGGYGGTRTPNCYYAEDAQAVYPAPPRYRRKNKQDPAPHNYRMWRPCLLLRYFSCFFYTPTAPNTGVPTPCYNTLLQSISVNSPHNTRYNSKWVLPFGDVHPKPGHRRVYQLRRDCRLVPGTPVPFLDIEEYARHLVVNTNRQYYSLDNVANEQDRDMKLATWNIQGAQGTVSLQRWASDLHLIQQCRIDLYGIQEYNLGFPLPETATTALDNEYKCYVAPGTEPRVAFLVRNTVFPMSSKGYTHLTG